MCHVPSPQLVTAGWLLANPHPIAPVTGAVCADCRLHAIHDKPDARWVISLNAAYCGECAHERGMIEMDAIYPEGPPPHPDVFGCYHQVDPIIVLGLAYWCEPESPDHGVLGPGIANRWRIGFRSNSTSYAREAAAAISVAQEKLSRLGYLVIRQSALTIIVQERLRGRLEQKLT